jgi:hypothetical protein
MDERHKVESAELHDIEHRLQRAWHLYLSPPQNASRESIGCRRRLLKQWFLVAELEKLRVDGAPDLVLLLDAPGGRERSAIPQHEVH